MVHHSWTSNHLFPNLTTGRMHVWDGWKGHSEMPGIGRFRMTDSKIVFMASFVYMEGWWAWRYGGIVAGHEVTSEVLDAMTGQEADESDPSDLPQ